VVIHPRALQRRVLLPFITVTLAFSIKAAEQEHHDFDILSRVGE
jgi:hypothetical protein